MINELSNDIVVNSSVICVEFLFFFPLHLIEHSCAIDSGYITQQEVVDPSRLKGPKLEPEGPRADVGFPTADQGFSSIEGTWFDFCVI